MTHTLGLVTIHVENCSDNLLQYRQIATLQGTYTSTTLKTTCMPITEFFLYFQYSSGYSGPRLIKHSEAYSHRSVTGPQQYIIMPITASSIYSLTFQLQAVRFCTAPAAASIASGQLAYCSIIARQTQTTSGCQSRATPNTGLQRFGTDEGSNGESLYK